MRSAPSTRLRRTSTDGRRVAELRPCMTDSPLSAIPLEGSPDMNVLINQRHPAAAQITIAGAEPFAMDMRLS